MPGKGSVRLDDKIIAALINKEEHAAIKSTAVILVDKAANLFNGSALLQDGL